MVTSSPRSSRASTRFEPMKPAPPVTSARIGRRILASASAEFGAVPSPRMRGLFVTFEGIDRSGKTTQARLLCEALGDDALGVREPGGTEVGERVREILKDPAVPLGPEGEALLFAAARAELVARVIRPALAEGRVVVSDRFLDSSLAYQGAARGLGVDEVERVNAFATGGLRARPHLPARDRPRRPRRRARARPTASRTRALRSRSGCSPPTRSWPRPTRAAGGESTPTARPSRCTPTCWPRSRRRARGRGRDRARRHRGPPAGAHGARRRARGQALPRLPLPRPGRHRQAHSRARVRRRAAGPGDVRPRATRAAARCTAPTPTSPG